MFSALTSLPGPRREKFTLVLDSSQIASFLNCPQYWYNSSVRRLVPATITSKDEAMNSGTYGHKLLDIYYRNAFKNMPLNDNIAACFQYDPDKDTCECGCMRDVHKDLSIGAETLNECQRCHKCIKFRPKQFPLSEEARFTVRNRFRDYAFKYSQGNDFRAISENHVEVGFSEPIFEDAENLFVLEGRMDVIGMMQGLKLVIDHKFQMSTHWLYGKSIQFKNYAMVGRTNMLMINYVRLTKKFDANTLARDIIPFTQVDHMQWKKKLIAIYFHIKHSLEQREQTGTIQHNWNMCGTMGGKTYQKTEPRSCWYGQLCETDDPKLVQIKEQQLYKVSDIEWKPW